MLLSINFDVCKLPKQLYKHNSLFVSDMLSTKMPKILIVGSGLTGSLVAASLLKLGKENINDQFQLAIWEKARGAGNF